jgi:glycosyltransferase involved in cell wall biosynthesis
MKKLQINDECKRNFCVVIPSLLRAGYTPIFNLTSLLSKLGSVYLISGKQLYDGLKLNINVANSVNSRLRIRLLNYILTQIKVLLYTIFTSRKSNYFVFFLGGEGLFIPILALKLLRKNVILLTGGTSVKIYKIREDPLSNFLSLLVAANFFLADKIITYSRALMQELNLKWNKTVFAHEHFIDFTIFSVREKYKERANIVGYIGRFSKEKGILNFMTSIFLVLKHKKDVHFMVCGDGELRSDVEKITREGCLEEYVKLTGWIPHKNVPEILNKFKLLVLPSCSEGLPNVILEAMACGTPVLATPVGAIPDIIKDGETGFLLKSNDPKHIADKIIELLNKPELLEKVSKNAYNYVRENFSYEKTLESWRKIIREIEAQK